MKRQFQRWMQLRKEARITPRLHEVLAEITRDLPELKGVKPKRSGHRGHDTTYFLLMGNRPKAVLRLNNPHTSRPYPLPEMPFRLAAPPERIRHEMTAYTLGSGHGITPTPIWHAKDALLCRYEDCQPLMQQLEAYPAQAWNLMRQASETVHRLHGLGLTHMDMSFNNILSDGDRQLVVDFEYTPAEGVNLASQRAYDHLRLLESIWKFIPDQRSGFAPWLAQVGDYLGAERAQVQLDRLAPAISRLMADAALKPALLAMLDAKRA